MANTKSALKQIRKNNLKRLQNKFVLKTTKTAIKKLKLESKKNLNAFPKISSLIDKLAKKKIIHKNKSNRIKSKLVKLIN
ncbi:MAG: 30S ribosomal protein S20 [Candidatus Sulcia muelleri]|uniref:Small ribosomal subunit protein bS20 n=1 Tax=Karelsulcia muelleri (strain GWSS) TaxID=444179 RepID=RS20_KARMG|nr:RecName: Full=Small ribosomal subunit protein bS20; AltName: Full=30S ribosomal protein S20 [Candidatus Karelsulcia muelleri GWSS]EAT14082.1 ribosomal protein S20 [Candidatus Karelsulcia muelleri str. Hc (Homalodisca coagulata)]MBS0018918.1 30S ribosomal protein S20 [Candidatus Karelsulcia muelleri]ABS30602.1 30S ribosomal subunit protein S20 [Candidatus Karelsulcia muelleri GWSS]MCJ7422562.1 30S ribosomal protein S20 [Candidatus Karelsulcia muelleri]MCJ7468659.1 30S ribosomal protein S20 [